MKVLMINQAFFPDVVSTAQHAADIATALAAAGHSVTAYASTRAYDEPRRRFPKRDTWRGVTVERIGCSGLGKGSLWRRFVDFSTFAFNAALKLVASPKFDVVIALTSPPLIAFLAALIVRLRGGRLLYWVMDLNPDQAIAAGVLRAEGLSAKLLERILRYALATASRIVVLDRFMQERIITRSIDRSKTVILPPWSHDHAVSFDQSGRERFRSEHGLTGKFVIMYSGNHSPCHPLETLLQAAGRLEIDESIVFCFIGGGSEHRRIREYARVHGKRNILCLPYQPLNSLSDSLSAADLHVVVMGNPYVGIVHPCKVYNIVALGTPVLYVGPRESHVGDLAQASHSTWLHQVEHGDVDGAIASIQAARTRGVLNLVEEQRFAEKFSAHTLIPQFIAEVERLANVESGMSVGSAAELAATGREKCSKVSF